MNIIRKYLYRSGSYPERAINIGQLENLAYCIINATFLTEAENQFNTIEDIEEYLGDTLTMVQVTNNTENTKQ